MTSRTRWEPVRGVDWCTARMHPEVRVVGYGVRLSAPAGAELGRAPTNDDSLVGAWHGNGERHDCFVSVRDGVASVRAHGRARTDAFACEPDDARRTDTWRIELPRFSCAWPRGLALRVLPPGLERWEFELADARAGVIVLRGPLRALQVPAPTEIVAKGQELVRSDLRPHAMFVETRYERGPTPWRARTRYAVREAGAVVLVTGQAPEGAHAGLFAVVDEIAASIRLS